MGALSLRDESRSRDEISERFVGQVLGRPSPVVDFRAAARIDSQSDAQVTLQVEPKSDGSDVCELSDDDVYAESVVRLSQRPTVQVDHPVIANVVRHTRIELSEIAPSGFAIRGVRQVTHFAFATAAVLIALSAVAIGSRMAQRGPVLFPSYLAAATSIKDLRAERHFTEAAGDDVAPDAAAESVDGVLALAAPPPPHATLGAHANHPSTTAHATTASRTTSGAHAAATHASHARNAVHASGASSAHPSQPRAAHPAAPKSSGAHPAHSRTPARG